MVVDCGGGTVDITVYEMASDTGKLKELYMATGGPYGSAGESWWFYSNQLRVWALTAPVLYRGP